MENPNERMQECKNGRMEEIDLCQWMRLPLFILISVMGVFQYLLWGYNRYWNEACKILRQAIEGIPMFENQSIAAIFLISFKAFITAESLRAVCILYFV